MIDRILNAVDIGSEFIEKLDIAVKADYSGFGRLPHHSLAENDSCLADGGKHRLDMRTGFNRQDDRKGIAAQVEMEPDQAIVCLVGENIRYTPGVAARVFTALRNLNIRMISQGASLLNLSVVVMEKDLRHAVEGLHTEFFSELDPEVFE